MPAAIDADQAGRVADAFLAAPRMSSRAPVHAAYADLGAQADRWFFSITAADARRSVRVGFTRCQRPYSSAAELSEAVRCQRMIEITPCAYDRDRRHPVLDCSIGGTYDRFRAVHDIVSHGWQRYGFDRDGEVAAWVFEDRMYTGLARRALGSELHGEHSVLWTTGHPAEHKATLLDPQLLGRSRMCATATPSS